MTTTQIVPNRKNYMLASSVSWHILLVFSFVHCYVPCMLNVFVASSGSTASCSSHLFHSLLCMHAELKALSRACRCCWSAVVWTWPGKHAPNRQHWFWPPPRYYMCVLTNNRLVKICVCISPLCVICYDWYCLVMSSAVYKSTLVLTGK